MKTKSEFKIGWWAGFKRFVFVRVALVVLLAAAIGFTAVAQAFDNLDFEFPTFVSVPSGYSGSVDAAAALPCWSVFWGTNPAPFVLYDNMFLDSAGVSILDTNMLYGLQPFEGDFSVLLQGGFSLASYPDRQSVAIAQSGAIPTWAKSLLFDAGMPAGESNFVVSVAGENLPFYALTVHANYIVYELDISRFSGQTAEIRFTANPNPSPGLAINNIYLDDIRFSSTPLPPFNYTITNGTITITGYTGLGGAMIIPSTINGLPVVAVADRAFTHSSLLTSASIPYSITNIGIYAFADCPNLSTIVVEAANSCYRSVDGVLFNKNQTTLIQCPGGIAGSYAVPNGVINIGDDAFKGCARLVSVSLPDSVTNIGNAAFMDCTSLTRVTIPDRVTSIRNGVFGGCSSLTSVTIPNSVSNLGDGAFRGCSSLTSVTFGNRVANIGNTAFEDCTSLTSIMIPNNVTNLGYSAFAFCTNLTSVTIGSGVNSIGVNAFFGCTSLAAIMVNALSSTFSTMDGVLFNKGQTALIQCPAGKAGTYVVPNSVTNIEDWAFATCTSLTNIIIGNRVANIGICAFIHCANLTTVAIGNGVTSIGDGAFEECGSLINVTIPNNVTNLGNGAFEFCTGLTSIAIGSGVKSIGSYAFAGCTNLTNLYFEGDAPSADATVFGDDTNATVYYLPGTIGWGQTFCGLPTALWIETPTLQTSPQTQTAEAGSEVHFWAQATNALPLFYAWYFNHTNFIRCDTNGEFELTNVQFSGAGVYTVVISNALGAVTSSPAMLNVIAPVERRPVPGISLMGAAGTSLKVEYTDALGPPANWLPLDTINLTNPPQFYFDVTAPLPSQRFYRAWQSGSPSAAPSLSLPTLVPAITLNGNIGSSLRLDYINAIGPTDVWVTLDTVTLTNTSQLYFDTSSIGQPRRLYRITPIPD